MTIEEFARRSYERTKTMKFLQWNDLPWNIRNTYLAEAEFYLQRPRDTWPRCMQDDYHENSSARVSGVLSDCFDRTFTSVETRV